MVLSHHIIWKLSILAEKLKKTPEYNFPISHWIKNYSHLCVSQNMAVL